MFCPNCGLQVEEGANFCRACGHSLGSAVPLQTLPAPTIPASAPVAAQVVYAGFWLRFVAYMIDGVILGIPFVLIVIVLVSMVGGFPALLRRRAIDHPVVAAYAGTAFAQSIDRSVVAVFTGSMVLLFLFAIVLFMGAKWLYFALMESSARQATFGKAAMSLRVTDLEGRRLSFKHATGRFFAKLITGLIPLGIGYMMAGFTEKKQALHDMIAGTLVLRSS